MSDKETSRLSRLTSILILLLSNRMLTATTIAKKFDISIRTVYRDIRALEAAGVPIITEEGKGYMIMEGYKIPPVMFTEKEAFALITAEQIALKSKDASLIREFTGAITKIKSVLRQSAKEKAILLTSRMHIGKNFEAEITSNILMDLQMALADFQLVRIGYRTAEGAVSVREIEPFALYYSTEENWVLAAFCRLRNDFRIFRIDRMTDVCIPGETFKPHQITIKQFMERYG